MYFHRQKGIISSIFIGRDYLENVDADLEEFLKNTQIKRLGWECWRQYLSLDVNNIPILLVPLKEIVELQTQGELQHWSGPSEKPQKIKVPISFEETTNGQEKVKEFIEVWRYVNGPKTVSYRNALGKISVSTFYDVVEY